MCYIDHHVFLPMNHKYKLNARAFNGRNKSRSSLASLKWDINLRIVRKLHQ